ncbi:MAG: hypothetical protein K2M82_05595, partial [Lachnospiraceae bacterium]|nr:hypothetical protein [Lachnospiraceae bacterium]
YESDCNAMRKIEAPLLEVSNIHKKHKAIDIRGFNVNVGRGDCVAVLHKSPDAADLTASIISGHTTPDKGKIYYKGDNINGVIRCFGAVKRKPNNKRLKSVANNAALPLIKRGLPRSIAEAAVAKEIEIFGLKGYENDSFGSLNTTAAYRSELYSAYMWSHEFMVIDEPFMELDEEERSKELVWLRETAGKTGLAILVFTEDIDTALALASSVMVVNEAMRSQGIVGVDRKRLDITRNRINELYYDI